MYHEGNRALQDAFGSRALADRLEEKLAHDRFTEGDAAFIHAQSFFFLATADAEGRPDCSFKGGPPGLARVVAPDLLVFPDYDGNGMFKSLGNIVANPHVGLLFVLPGREETLRVNGRAWLTTDDAVLDGFTAELKRPKAAIGVAVAEAFVHCAKSFRRGQVWEPASWMPDAAPSAAEMLTCHIQLEATPDELAADLEQGYAHDLAAERA
jgi:PPOX class probable FMN-dependent enzyme